jgi:hypothetical protein
MIRNLSLILTTSVLALTLVQHSAYAGAHHHDRGGASPAPTRKEHAAPKSAASHHEPAAMSRPNHAPAARTSTSSDHGRREPVPPAKSADLHFRRDEIGRHHPMRRSRPASSRRCTRGRGRITWSSPAVMCIRLCRTAAPAICAFRPICTASSGRSAVPRGRRIRQPRKAWIWRQGCCSGRTGTARSSSRRWTGMNQISSAVPWIAAVLARSRVTAPKTKGQ